MRDDPWTDATIARLKQLWGDKSLSAAEIGRRLNLSKNAVIGKVHRLDLPPRASPIKRVTYGEPRGEPRPPKRSQRSPTRPSPTFPALPSLHPDLPPGAAGRKYTPASPRSPPTTKSLPTLSRSNLATPLGSTQPCCWPLGDPGTPGFRFCDAPALPGKPYCGEHAARAYVKAKRREDAEPA